MRKHNPFTPGTGKSPPRLVGRQGQQGEYHGYLARLRDQQRGELCVLYGPRGVGKTVLLNWLEAECVSAGVTVVQAQPDRNGEVPKDRLAELLPDAGAGQVTVEAGAGVDLGMRLHGSVKATRSAAEAGQEGGLEGRLRQACLSGPRALLVDEAHNLAKGARIELLNLAQNLIDKAPFLLALAGTPGLALALRGGSTFVERAPKMSIGLLSEAAAAEAIEAPMQEDGVSIDRQGMRGIVEDAQRYPFFLQQWGRALWDCASQAGAQHLGKDEVQAAAKTAQAQRLEFYEARYSCLRRDAALLTAAVAVGEAYDSGGQFDEGGVVELISQALAAGMPDADARRQKAQALTDALNAMDYVWRPQGSIDMIPGIPSFMTYVRERHQGVA